LEERFLRACSGRSLIGLLEPVSSDERRGWGGPGKNSFWLAWRGVIVKRI
jgi:hypothetical protein